MISCNLDHRRPPHEWEVELFTQFLLILESITLGEGDDMVVWNLVRTMTYFVKSMHSLLVKNMTDLMPKPSSLYTVFRYNDIPARVGFYLWDCG